MDSVVVGLRFAAYVDLMLLAGFALGGGLGRHAPAISRRVVAALSAIGAIITVAQFGATCLAMTGNDMAALDGEMLAFMAFETSMGISHVIRATALGLLTVISATGRAGRPLVAGLAIVALGSLAWTGHAGASEAALGWLHRSSDIVHLLSGAIWIAALAMFARILLANFSVPGSAERALAALKRFSSVGTAVVGAIVVTGAVNLVAIVGIDGIWASVRTDYGRLLVIKLMLLAGMLCLAAGNRWILVPQLKTSLEAGHHAAALRRLHLAIRTETMLALALLAVVAVLGTLSPAG
ncbi:copper resistance protein CopD [Sphingomonas spermidinifaciens]|uniref:Copper resistance protein CopD n=1 Tax=Sphingomonas spermidinifaciens TaxID=1141889 RepID=A0A2A4AZ24_9SPHN|nr:copper homeostasis membrane protein CopD [Sphingomonas spermidinifaciens]PCD02193.1 copper resistance protein CopD [Sphingomonas spermidinifaciens]